MYPPDLKYVALPDPEIRGVTKVHCAVINVLYGYWIVVYSGFARFALLLHA